MSRFSPGDFIGTWISLIKTAAARIEPAGAPLDDYIERLALASIVQGLANLRTFPWIAERDRQGKLGLHGAYFGVSMGTLLALDGVSGRFEPIAAGAHRAAFSGPGSYGVFDPIEPNRTMLRELTTHFQLRFDGINGLVLVLP
jgi:carbonic anhydrase